MPLLPRLQRAAFRPRRALRLVNATIETLEVRALLSSAAVIQWSMAPRITLDPAHGNEPDLPNTPAYVNPPNGFDVLLDASHSVGILPTSTFSWTVTYPNGQTTPLSGEDPSIDLPQASYQGEAHGNRPVRHRQAGLHHHQHPGQGHPCCFDRRLLRLGRGEPGGPGSPRPAVGLLIRSRDEHRERQRPPLDHRGPAQFALELQESNPHEAVTFVSVANSGASIPVGVLGPMPSIGDSSYELPAEITELKQLIGTQHIDVLTVTVGADDIGFTTLAEDLIDNTYFGDPSLKTILKDYNTSLNQLPQHFAELASAIQALNPGQVLVTGYPDITRNQNGQVAGIYGPLDIPLISKADAAVHLAEDHSPAQRRHRQRCKQVSLDPGLGHLHRLPHPWLPVDHSLDPHPRTIPRYAR